MQNVKKNYIELNDEVLKEIVKVFASVLDNIDYDTLNVADIELKLLEEGNRLYRRVKYLVGANRQVSQPELDRWFNDILQRELKNIHRELLDANISNIVRDDEGVKNKAIVVKNHMDITFDMVDNRYSYNTRKLYNKVSSNIVNSLNNNLDINKIKEDVGKQVGRDRISVKTDKAGRQWNVEPYLNIVETGNEKRIKQVVKDRMYDDNEIDLVIVTELADSRPSHVDYQGNIYYRGSGTHPKYPHLSTTGYGEIDGIETGINCRHRVLPWTEGKSKTTKHNIPKSKINKNYEASQKQRYYERKIREKKREKMMMKELAVDNETLRKADKRIKDFQAKQRQHLKDTGRRRRYDRESINYSKR